MKFHKLFPFCFVETSKVLACFTGYNSKLWLGTAELHLISADFQLLIMAITSKVQKHFWCPYEKFSSHKMNYSLESEMSLKGKFVAELIVKIVGN